MSYCVTSILSTFYPSMWLNSDWFSEVFPVAECQVSIRSSWGVRNWKSVLFSWALSGAHRLTGQTLRQWCGVPIRKASPILGLSIPGPWRWHALGHAAGSAPFSSKCSQTFLFLPPIIFFCSLNLLICLLQQLHFLPQLQCSFIFPKALSFPCSVLLKESFYDSYFSL